MINRSAQTIEYPPLIARNGCLYADGESTVIVPLERMTERHQVDSRYQNVAEKTGIITASRVTGMDNRITPIYTVMFDNGQKLPFFEWEVNHKNLRTFNNRKVFNYRPHIRYTVGERVKMRTADIIYIKIKDDQVPLLGKEVVVDSVILCSDSNPKYVVWFESEGVHKRITICEELIRHSIDGRWQKENSWMYDLECRSFPDFVVASDLLF